MFLVEFSGHFAIDSDLRFFCHTATIPSWQIHTVPNKIYGVTKEMPSDISYSSAKMSFYIDRSWELPSSLYSYKDKVINSTSHSFKYYDDYVFDTRIKVLDASGVNDMTISEFALHNCFIKNIDTDQVSYGAINTVHNIHIDLTYEYFEMMFSAAVNENMIGVSSPLESMSRSISGIKSIQDEIGSSLNFDTVRTLMPEAANAFDLSKLKSLDPTKTILGDASKYAQDKLNNVIPSGISLPSFTNSIISF
jgi:hypothetical protein